MPVRPDARHEPRSTFDTVRRRTLKNRRDRLRRTLADLYERCSAGTHVEVTLGEARFIFLQTYIPLVKS
jgi:hypothetical protein